MGKFRRGALNIVHDLRVKIRMARAVSSSLKNRSAGGLAVGRRRRGEVSDGEGYRGPRFHSTRRYTGLDEDGKQIIAGRREGMSERELARLLQWPPSTVHDFLVRNGWRLKG